MNDAGRPGREDPDPLDSLLDLARWPEPQAAGVERLWRHWLAHRRRATWRRRALLAAAAALLLSFSTLWFWTAWLPSGRPVPAIAPPLVQIAVAEPARLTEPRPPTAYEQLLLTARARQQRPASRPVEAPAELEPTERPPIQQAVSHLAADPAASVSEVAARYLGGEPRRSYEAQLIAMIRQGTESEQLAATQLLSHLGSMRTLPLLLELAAWPQTRVAAMTGVARIAPPAALYKLARAEPDPALRRQMLAALLERGTPESVSMFLNLLADRRTAPDALESLDQVTDPPVELLFHALDGPSYAVRVAAARALGRIDGPVVSGRLATMVLRDVNRREALLALAASPAPDAAQFLAIVERNTALAANIRAARSQLETLQ